MGVSNNIKKLRSLNNLYQKQLADKVGVSSQVISNWERGYTKPNEEDLNRLADALDCSVDELLGRTPKEKKEYTYDFDKFDVLMFSDKEGFDNLTDDEKQELWEQINDQIEFLIQKKNKDKK